MRIRTVYGRGFVGGSCEGQWEVAEAAVRSAAHAQVATTAGRQWLDDLAGHPRRLGHTAGEPVPPEADLPRTPADQVRAVTRHLPSTQASKAVYRCGFTDGRIAGVAVAARDLYLAAGQSLGSLRLAIDGRAAHQWLGTIRPMWDHLAARGEIPLPGTPALLARSTLTAGAMPAHTTGLPGAASAWSVQRAARPAPAAGPHTDQPPATPAPARGVARITYHPAARR